MKKNKLLFYIKGYADLIAHRLISPKGKPSLSKKIKRFDATYLRQRVKYYNKLSPVTSLLPGNAIALKDFNTPRKPSAYYFDTIRYTKHFARHLKISFVYGDVIDVPSAPSFVKSRPVGTNNENSVLLKLNRPRHYNLVKDHKSFGEKKNMLIGRGLVSQEHRVRFYEKYFGHCLCDIGQTNTNQLGNPLWVKPKISKQAHLDYKFILCLEGNDVATNLKWVMGTQSIAVMPRPKYETWFMEGMLLPDHHYICIDDDYADLEEKLLYYIAHPDEAEQIIHNANEHLRQFRNEKQEDLISLLVLEKYFYDTGQVSDTTIAY